jgi:hypothetical protein
MARILDRHRITILFSIMHAEEPAWWFRSGAGITVSLSSWMVRLLRIDTVPIFIDDDHIGELQQQVTDLQQLPPTGVERDAWFHVQFVFRDVVDPISIHHSPAVDRTVQ